MLENIQILNEKFKEIKRMGWIKEIGNGFSKIGATFEKAIGKTMDDLPIPDFHGIEIKTMHSHNKQRLHLFNLNPDGDYLFSIKRILNKLGYKTKDSFGQRVLFQRFNSLDYSVMPFNNKAKIVVDHQKEKVMLVGINSKGEDIELNTSWSFAYLKEMVELKLNYLAIIRALSQIIDNKGYYHYHTINFYKFKGFDTFISLIEKGIIHITFSIGVHKVGKKIGQTYNHGTNFTIDIENINLLYDEIII